LQSHCPLYKEKYGHRRLWLELKMYEHELTVFPGGNRFQPNRILLTSPPPSFVNI
jgi:hypothetical protein